MALGSDPGARLGASLDQSGLKSRKNQGNWQKSWENKPKTEQLQVFRLTNAGQSRIVNGGGFIFTRINTGFPEHRASCARAFEIRKSGRSGKLEEQAVTPAKSSTWILMGANTTQP
jgi:hypothetical protein